MVEHDDADPVAAGDRLQAREEVLGELRLDRVDDRDTLLAPHQIAVVGRAVGGAQDDNEGAQTRIERADPVHAERRQQ
jgi:hypothetical protein|nr:hypothetical protein [Thiocapsa sp. UBA6158]